VSQCSQEVKACLTLTSVVNRLPSRCYLRNPNGLKPLGPILPNQTKSSRLITAPDGMLWPTLPNFPNSAPIIYFCLDHLRILDWEAFEAEVVMKPLVIPWLQAQDTHLLAPRHTPWDQCSYVSMITWRYEVNSYPVMCCVYNGVRKKFSASVCFF
jgi:hypothetical protein